MESVVRLKVMCRLIFISELYETVLYLSCVHWPKVDLMISLGIIILYHFVICGGVTGLVKNMLRCVYFDFIQLL